MLEMPKMFRSRDSEPARDVDNVFHLSQDDIPTRPQGTRPPEITPPPSSREVREFLKEYTSLPEHIAIEVSAGQRIFELLMELDDHPARERVMAMVETMMELYVPKPEPDQPHPQGAPV